MVYLCSKLRCGHGSAAGNRHSTLTTASILKVFSQTRLGLAFFVDGFGAVKDSKYIETRCSAAAASESLQVPRKVGRPGCCKWQNRFLLCGSVTKMFRKIVQDGGEGWLTESNVSRIEQTIKLL